jgi:hypothetical protein
MTRQSLSRTKSLCRAYLVSIILVTQPCLAAEEIVVASVRRPDPRSGELVPVDPEQIKPGKIYNHFSHRDGRYVWAFANEGGRFSYALGTGSTELPSNFDLVTSARQTEEFLEAEAGPWAEKSRLSGSPIWVRLGADEKWQIVHGSSIRSHYDIDSGRRWEWHGKRRVAVLHTNGYFWQYNGRRYVPTNPWLVSFYQHDGHCSCADCGNIAAR